jgi:adenylylsulfate kinase
MQFDSAEGRVVWFTGLSGAGKSTLCNKISLELNRCGARAHILDGDDLRKGLCSDLGFSAEDRAENVRRALHVASILSTTGSVVLVALITPFQAMRDLVREKVPGILEVFVDAPLCVCERRDPKGLYRRARAGDLPNFTGLTSGFEVPSSPDIVCHTDQETIEQSAAKILDRLLPDRPRGALTAERRRTIAVDFDGVIADYGGWIGDRDLGAPRRDVIAALHQLRNEGWKIVVHTTRSANAIRGYLIEADVPFDEINSNTDYVTGGYKPVATVYWDDRAIRYSGDGTRDLPFIRSFRTWNGRT